MRELQKKQSDDIVDKAAAALSQKEQQAAQPSSLESHLLTPTAQPVYQIQGKALIDLLNSPEARKKEFRHLSPHTAWLEGQPFQSFERICWAFSIACHGSKDWSGTGGN